MKLTLPFPPSANRYWRSCRGIVFLSGEAKKYKATLLEDKALAQVKPLDGRVAISLDYYRPRKSGDLDNRLKQILDCLQGVAYLNDSQIVEIHARQFDDKTNPRVEVEVLELSP
jgi:crossover junction endodeoxyribonuclease RusA